MGPDRVCRDAGQLRGSPPLLQTGGGRDVWARMWGPLWDWGYGGWLQRSGSAGPPEMSAQLVETNPLLHTFLPRTTASNPQEARGGPGSSATFQAAVRRAGPDPTATH